MVRQAIRWTITLNNYTVQEYEEILALGADLSIVRYLIVGKEVGEREGTPHLQIYLELKKKKTLGGVKKVLACFQRAHLEESKGDAKSNITYCQKDGDYLEFGKVKSSGFRSDLEQVKKDIDEGMSMDEMIDTHFSIWVRYRRSIETYWNRKNGKTRFKVPDVYVYHGHSGTGKTRTAWEFDPESTWTYPGHCWFDGYEGQRVAIFDEFDGSDLGFSLWKQITDGYPMSVRVKGGHTKWQPEIIVFTSNVDPKHWWAGEDKPPFWQEQMERRIKENKHFE